MATTRKRATARATPVAAPDERTPRDFGDGGVPPSPQAAPVVFRNSKNAIVLAIKVDSVKRVDAGICVTGWSAGVCVLQLVRDGQAADEPLLRSKRADVAAALKTDEPDEGFGFSVTSAPGHGSFGLRLMAEIEGRRIDTVYPLTARDDRGAAGEASMPLGALGYIESAMASAIAGDGVLAGWVLHESDVKVWIETEDGLPYSLSAAHRVYRQDVLDAHGATFGGATSDPGFIVRLPDVKPGQTLRLVAQRGAKPVVLADVRCGSLPTDPVAASRWLFGLSTPLGDMHRRLPNVDMPIIKALAEHQQRAHAALPVVDRQLGTAPLRPLVSVIVPLYGRADFVEHQLLEFCRDPWFLDNAELIYVLDDPKLVSSFTTEAEALYRLYRVPFRWVWGAANRGFSGANNLGASRSTAPHLLFLNSDVFPQGPGWLQELLDVLVARDRVGAVGCRLVFASGSIQHAGMEFLRREELGIWVNHHPCMGLASELDPKREITVVPAVTGACLAMRRAQFDQVKGWDTGYLIGDFEDSDLCMKLRTAGWDIAYHPGVQLTHLERQSFKLLGHDEYRTRVVIHNAVRHQEQWASVLSAPPMGRGL